MKTVSRILMASALVSVAACGKLPEASLGGTFGVQNFLNANIPTEGLDFPAQTYSAALGREYQNLARIAATEDVNWIDASAYMQKGLAALRGEQVQPWAPEQLGLSGEIDSVYSTLRSTINAGAWRNPVACARALALYDNYAEELSEGAHACTDPNAILAELNDALEACGYQKAAAPAPVYRAPPSAPAPIAVAAPPPPPLPVAPLPAAPVDACFGADVPAGCTCATVNDQAVLSCPQPEVVAAPPPPPPPAPAAVPVAVAAPAPALPLNYTIYFGYDRCDLTAEAGQVINEASSTFQTYNAQYADVIGHTDTRGSKAYNTRLANCRANAVADSLAAQGINRQQLRVGARSELDPAVSTGDGVREALNRRVNISIVQ